MNKEFFYGLEVIPYIQSQLSLGKSLAHYVLQNKKLEKATARAFLPETTTPERRERFHSGIFDSPANESRTQVTDFLTSLMMNLRFSVAIFDDWLSKPEHAKHLSKHGLDFLVYSDEIYLFVKEDNCEQLFQKGIAATSPYPAIGVITQSHSMNEFYSGMEISEELFNDLCKEISHLIIGAYDDETYIILSWL